MAGCRCGGSESVPKPKPKWYWSTGFLVIVFLSLPPLALPLIWFSPKRTVLWKFLGTVVTLAVTFYLGWFMADVLPGLIERFQELRKELGI